MLPDFNKLRQRANERTDLRSLEHRSDNRFVNLRSFQQFAKACGRGANHGYRITLIGKLPAPFPLNCDRSNASTHFRNCTGTITTVHHSQLTSAYIGEWLASSVSLGFIHANVRYTAGDDAVDLLTHHAIAEMGGHAAQYATTAVINLRKRYQHVLAGGWWVSGLDPLNDWQPMDWGQFKPITPRTSWRDPDKVIKYEAPAKQSTRALFLAVTWADGLKIAERYQRGDAYQQRIKETIRKAYPAATNLSHRQTLALTLDRLNSSPIT
ncbi:MAG: hypothetical protein AB8B99_18450, partial [Phormidesmis sp.]